MPSKKANQPGSAPAETEVREVSKNPPLNPAVLGTGKAARSASDLIKSKRKILQDY